jgi:lysine-ketoglutarate reductase/saccharopine dehydrogenase-like protein (TIGR00300 family)
MPGRGWAARRQAKRCPSLLRTGASVHSAARHSQSRVTRRKTDHTRDHLKNKKMSPDVKRHEKPRLLNSPHADGGKPTSDAPSSAAPASAGRPASPEQPEAGVHVEDVRIKGHIIDSLILPKVLDSICAYGGTFRIKRIAIGQTRSDSSSAIVEVRAEDAETLDRILAQISDHGAVSTTAGNCRVEEADVEGAFPDGFYSTTNQRTEIRLDGRWLPVEDQEMDCGILVSPDRRAARCVPMSEVGRGESFVVGHDGIRVFPEERRGRSETFEFMGSAVSTEKPKGVAIRRIAQQLADNRAARRDPVSRVGTGQDRVTAAPTNGGRTLLVAGPAIVHTGSGEFLCELIRRGYVDVLFAGNALAAHDIEQAMFGTSLGVYLDGRGPAEAGHEHHLRAINRIRRAGGIRRAVESGLLTSGIMYECVRQGTDFLLAGSIRDDGPLPDVITDVLEAQRRMRRKLRGVSFCLMVATTLHSVAVGNLLPSWVRVVCVDINPSTAIKLADRGSFQTAGLVTDVAPFMRALVEELDAMDALKHGCNTPHPDVSAGLLRDRL